ncbi:MAG TPA: PEGA domain-containing protein [Polyangiaceae bacterium]
MKTPQFTLVLLATTLMVEVAAAKPPTAASSATNAAADPSGSQAEEASQRFQRGVKLYRERSFDGALAEFNRAYELAPNYRVLFNIGQVHAERGDYVAAIKAFRQYLNDGAGAIEPARASEVQSELTRLEGRIAKITVTSNVEGAELLVDGELMGSLPQALVPVNAGSRRISLRKKGYEADEIRVMLASGEEKAIEIKLQKDATQASRIAPASGDNPTSMDKSQLESPASSGLGVGFWVSLSATVIAGGATAVFGVLTNDANDNYDAALNHFPGTPSRIDDARQSLKRKAMLTDVCGAVTIVGLASTVYFAVTSGSEKPKEARVGARGLQTGPVTDGSRNFLWQVSGRF